MDQGGVPAAAVAPGTARPRVAPRTVVLLLVLGAIPAVLGLLIPQDTKRPLLRWPDLALAGAALAAGWAAGRWAPPVIGRRWKWLLPLALLPVLLQAVLLPTPITTDERAYLLQAELLAGGRLSEPLPQPACEPGRNLCPLHRRQVYEDAGRGVRYSKYSPGTSLALAPGAAVRAPWLIPALFALLDVFLVAALARRLGQEDAGLAPVLLLLCPFFFLVHTSFQSEFASLPAALAGYYGLLRVRGGARRPLAWGAGIGAAAGWIFCVRPLTGVLFALACVPGILWRTGGKGRLALAGALAGGLPLLGLALAYNWAQTGAPLTFPYHLYAVRFGPWLDPQGQVPLDVYGNGRLWNGLLDHGARWSVGVGVLGLAALGFYGLWRLRRQDGGSALAFAAVLPIAYALHWYPGHWAYLGPLYAFESLGFLVLGLAGVLGACEPRWRSGLVVALGAGGLALAGYRFGLIHEQSARCYAPEAAAAGAPPGAVVLLPYPSQREVGADPALAELRDDSQKYYTPSRPPLPPGTTVLVRELEGPRRTREALAALGLDGRPFYRFLPEEGGPGRLEPYAP